MGSRTKPHPHLQRALATLRSRLSAFNFWQILSSPSVHFLPTFPHKLLQTGSFSSLPQVPDQVSPSPGGCYRIQVMDLNYLADTSSLACGSQMRSSYPKGLMSQPWARNPTEHKNQCRKGRKTLNWRRVWLVSHSLQEKGASCGLISVRGSRCWLPCLAPLPSGSIQSPSGALFKSHLNP